MVMFHKRFELKLGSEFSRSIKKDKLKAFKLISSDKSIDKKKNRAAVKKIWMLKTS